MTERTVSHYRILDKLGEGGMGVVYRAHDSKLDREVALKFLTPQALEQGNDKTRFIREARAAASLHHPNICTIHEIDEHEGQLFIAMALVDGRSLRARIDEGPMPVDEAIDVVMQVCAGLHAAHEKGIVHRDVKPANIMCEASGRVLVMDFGLAQRKDTTRVTRTGTTVGTIAYMSPEQLRGGELDRRADVWALGVLLYELITGRLPFRGEVEPALMYSIMNEDPASVAVHRAEVPRGIEGIIARALEKKPDDRYADADALRADLEALRSDPTVFPAGMPIRRRARRRKRIALTVASLVVAAAALSPFVIPRLVGESQAIGSLAILPVANISGDPEQDSYATGMHLELISSLGKIDNLKVLGRRTVLSYGDSDLSTAEIANELGVDALMEGSMRLDGDQMHIVGELVDASTGQILWTDSFDANLSDVLNVQRQIALAVAENIHARLSPEIAANRDHQVDPEAYRLFLKQQANWASSDAIATLQKAVAIDSTFARAWAALSNRASYSGLFGHLPQREAYEIARTAAEKALELDPALADAHNAMATVYWQQDWDWGRAMAEVNRALTLNPTHGSALGSKAWFHFIAGRINEGIALYEEVLIPKDPLNPQPRMALGLNLINCGEYELAVEHLQHNHEVFPDDYFTRMLLSLCHAGLGRHDLAVEFRHGMEDDYSWMMIDKDEDGIRETRMGPRYRRGGGSDVLAEAYANTTARHELVDIMKEAKANYESEPTGRNAWLVAFYLIPLGETDEAREWLQISADSAMAHMKARTSRAEEEVHNQALLYHALDDREKTYEWLELAFEMRSSALADLYRKFRYESLHQDGRYAELLRRRGFPEEVVRNIRD